MSNKGLEFEIDKRDLERLNRFTKNILRIAEKSADKTIENLAIKTEKLVHKKLDTDDVPGPPLSQSWLRFKREHGFFTSKLQRFGRGDSRSYYENIVRRTAAAPGRVGWFVGVVKGTSIYDNAGNVKSGDMVDLVRVLEQRWPLWKDVLNEIFRDAPAMFTAVFGRRLRQSGININLRDS